MYRNNETLFSNRNAIVFVEHHDLASHQCSLEAHRLLT